VTILLRGASFFALAIYPCLARAECPNPLPEKWDRQKVLSCFEDIIKLKAKLTHVEIGTADVAGEGMMPETQWNIDKSTDAEPYRHFVGQPITFDRPFDCNPKIVVSIYHIDATPGGGPNNIRLSVKADKITLNGFEIVYETWGLSRIAGVGANWTAAQRECPGPDTK
jgi:H-type lectin domain